MPNIKTPPVKRYYPTVSSIIDTDEIPDALGFVKTGLINFLDKLYYKDFQYSKSKNGDAAFYSIGIISKERLDIEIPGTGIYFVLNPDIEADSDFNISLFPLTLEYEWKILAYLRDFDLDNFSFSPQEIFETALRILNINQAQAISQFINVFTEPGSNTVSHLEQYVVDVNTKLGTTIPTPTETTTLKEINEEIYNQTGDYSSMASFTVYVDTPDLEETKAKLKKYFRSLLPQDIEAYIIDLLLPKIKTALKLSGAIEFPRNILKPVYDKEGINPYDGTDLGVKYEVIEGDDKDDPKVLLTFGEVEFYASTEDGFGYNADIVINTSTPAQIGNTGLIIDIDNVKVDLSENSNIPEADQDGRPNSFKGVFIENASISFPNILRKDEVGSTASLVARNLLLGSEGGITGMIGFETDNIVFPINFVPFLEKTLIVDPVANGPLYTYTILNNAFNYNAATGVMTITGNQKVQVNENDEEPTLVEKTIDVTIPIDGLSVIDSENNHYTISNEGVVTASDGPGGLLKFNIFGAEININSFFLTFNKNKIVASTVTGTIDFDKLDEPLDITIDFTNGFRIFVELNEPDQDIIDNNLITLTLKDFELGRAEEKIFLGINGSITNNLNIPFVNQFIPKTIAFSPLKWVQNEGLEYDLKLTWSNKLTYSFSNEDEPSNEKKSVYFPIIQDKDSVFKLAGINMAIEPIDVPEPVVNTDPDYEKGVDASFTFKGAGVNLKGFTITVDGMGFTTKIRELKEEPESTGSTVMVQPDGDVGPFNTEFDFIPPKGLGIKIGRDNISGSGYLYFDFDKGKFVGVGRLKIKDKITVTIIGVLLTKLPDNEDGYSFLLSISAEGLSTDLGFGFTLTGVGGLVALHRSMNLQALRDGVKNKTLDNIMFPDDPIKDINLIVASLEKVFPIQEGRHTFGLMAQVKWGIENFITGEIGLMIEVPSPVKIAILGVIKAVLPKKGKPTLKIQINFLGTIDFEKKYITFDASIIDSKFAKFTLEGDMAFRLKWGDESNFLLSIGGFHPSYTPPPLDLPKLKRITINLLGKDNPKLTLTSYFALTSNTVQFGSKVDFKYKFEKFNNLEVVGFLGFDILLQFSPFYLQADLNAMLAVLRNKKAIASISFTASLEGPEPWHVQGKAEFTFLGKSIEVNFDETFGDHFNEILPDFDVWDEFKKERDKKENWSVEHIEQITPFVTIREVAVDDDEIIIDPNGVLTFSQSTVPLGFSIDKYGKQKPLNQTKFSVEITNSNINTEDVKDLFAPAQYIEMPDSQKLTRKSFERMNAGLRLVGSDLYTSSYFGNFKLDYESVIYDTIENRQTGNIHEESRLPFAHHVSNNAVANSSVGQNQSLKPSQSIKIEDESYAIANLDDLSIHNNLGIDLTFGSEAEAQVALEELFINNPALSNKIEVVAAYELA